MKRIIRLTESDIRRMVKRALFEERYGMNEFPQGLTIYDYAERWAAAVRDKMAGGPGVSEYKGKEYTIGDWLWAMISCYDKGGWAKGTIKAGIGDQIKHETQKAYGDEYDEETPNIYLQPEMSFVYDVFTQFMTDTERKDALQPNQERIANVQNPTGKDILNQIVKYLRTFASHIFREDKSEKIQNATGNHSFSTPVTHEKNISDYEGMEADPDIMTHVQDANDEIENAIDDYTYNDDEDKSLEKVINRFKMFFKVILDDAKLPPEQRTIGKFVSDVQYNPDGTIKRVNTRDRFVYAVQYLYDHYHEVFDHDVLVAFDKQVMNDVKTYSSGKERVQQDEIDNFVNKAYFQFIRNRVAEFICQAYNTAIKAGDTENYITKLFTGGKEKTVQDVAKILEPLWTIFKDGGKFGVGRQIKRQVYDRLSDDKLAESVSRAVNEAIRRLKRGSLYENRRRNRKRGLLF